MSSNPSRARTLAQLASWIVLLAPLAWGAHQPNSWDVDNIAPGSVLKGLSQHFGPQWYSSYGPLPYYLVALVYLPFLALFRFTGELGAPSATYPWGFSHPDVSVFLLVVLARLVTFALAMWSIVQVEREPHTDGARRPWLAPLAFTGSAAFCYYARTSNVDLFYVAWLFVAFHLAESASTRAGLAAAAAAAVCAVCSKEQAAPFAAAAIGLALWRARSLPGSALRHVLAVCAAAGLTYALLWKLPLHFDGWRSHHDFVFHVARYPRTYPLTPDGLAQMARRFVELMPVAFGWPALLGLALVFVVRPKLSGLGARAVGSALYLAGFLAPIGYIYPRFLLPLLVLVVPLALRGWEGAFARWGRIGAVRAALAVALVAAWVPGGPDLARVQLADTRVRVESWLRRLPPGTSFEIAGNPRFQARPPKGTPIEIVSPEDLSKAPRAPRRDVVLISSVDGGFFYKDPVVKAAWCDSLADSTRWRRSIAWPDQGFGSARGLIVSPIVTAYVRRGTRAEGAPPLR